MDLDAFLNAADLGQLDSLRAGLGAGIDVNAADEGGWTALLTASRAVQIGAVELLCEAGADPNATRPGGFTPLHMLLEAAKSSFAKKHLEVAASLLDGGADPNLTTTDGKQSAFRGACALGLRPLVEMMLFTGRVELDLRDKQKASPLFMAASFGDAAIVKLLLDAGASPDLPNRFGWTPLHAAVERASKPTVQVLLDGGADSAIATKYPSGRVRPRTTPAQMAEMLGNDELALLLHQAGANKEGRKDTRPWPDLDSPEATWVRDVIQGREHIHVDRLDRHILDSLFGRWAVTEEKARLLAGFRGLLLDPDPKIRSAAVHFFSFHDVESEDDLILRAWREHRSAFDGVQTTWYPGDLDLRGLLARSVARIGIRKRAARGLLRDEALTPGRAAQVIAGLLASDRIWLRDNLVDIIEGTPAALNILFASARVRSMQPEQFMRQLIGKIDDELLIDAIREALPEWREWLDGVVAQAQADTSLDVEQAEDDYLSESRAMLGKLLDYDSVEVIGKLDAMLDAAPELGEALVLEMASRHMDLRGVVVALRDRVERDKLKAWLQAAVSDELQLLVYMAMI